MCSFCIFRIAQAHDWRPVLCFVTRCWSSMQVLGGEGEGTRSHSSETTSPIYILIYDKVWWCVPSLLYRHIVIHKNGLIPADTKLQALHVQHVRFRCVWFLVCLSMDWLIKTMCNCWLCGFLNVFTQWTNSATVSTAKVKKRRENGSLFAVCSPSTTSLSARTSWRAKFCDRSWWTRAQTTATNTSGIIDAVVHHCIATEDLPSEVDGQHSLSSPIVTVKFRQNSSLAGGIAWSSWNRCTVPSMAHATVSTLSWPSRSVWVIDTDDYSTVKVYGEAFFV